MINNQKILIAEDELLIAKVMKMVFVTNGYEVKHVVDADSAINSIYEFNPDFIILDVTLKNKTSGIYAATQIRENGFTGPIFFTTGNSIEDTIEQTKSIKNAHLFIKPVDPKNILDYIKNLIK